MYFFTVWAYDAENRDYLISTAVYGTTGITWSAAKEKIERYLSDKWQDTAVFTMEEYTFKSIKGCSENQVCAYIVTRGY